jgi:hypothetical protein
MKYLQLIKKIGIKAASVLSLSLVSMSAFADVASDDTSLSIASLTQSVSALGGNIILVVDIIALIIGGIFIFQGLMHLKQQSHGSSQEKHLTKGIASLVFGAALILLIPLIHAIVGAAGDTGNASQFNMDVGTVSLS